MLALEGNRTIMKIFREDPPQKHTGTGRGRTWEPKLAQLVHEPNTWFNLGDASHGTVTYLRQHPEVLPPGRWEFTSRSNNRNSKRATLYARYLGPQTMADRNLRIA